MLTRSQLWGALSFVALWLLGLLLCAAFNSEFGPTDAPVEIPRATSALRGLPWITVETIVLYAILRPTAFPLPLRRVLVALALLLPWAALVAVGVWRPSFPGSTGWPVAHALWLVGVTATLMVILAVSLIHATRPDP